MLVGLLVAAAQLIEHFVVVLDGRLLLQPGVVTKRGGDVLVAEESAHQFMSTWTGIKKDLCTGVPVLVWCQPNTDMKPEIDRVWGLSWIVIVGGDRYKKTQVYDVAEYYAPEDDYAGYKDDNNER